MQVSAGCKYRHLTAAKNFETVGHSVGIQRLAKVLHSFPHFVKLQLLSFLYTQLGMCMGNLVIRYVS